LFGNVLAETSEALASRFRVASSGPLGRAAAEATPGGVARIDFLLPLSLFAGGEARYFRGHWALCFRR